MPSWKPAYVHGHRSTSDLHRSADCSAAFDSAVAVYARCTEYAETDAVPLVLDGQTFGSIAVADVMA